LLTSVYKRTRTFFTSACFCSRGPLPSPNRSATSTSPLVRIAGHTTSLSIAIRLAGRRSASQAARYGETTTRADKFIGRNSFRCNRLNPRRNSSAVFLAALLMATLRPPDTLPAKWKRRLLRRETRGPCLGTGSKCAISYSKDRRIQCFQAVTKLVIPPFDDWRLTSRRTENIGLKDGQILLE
jgi:hypothetical protein